MERVNLCEHAYYSHRKRSDRPHVLLRDELRDPRRPRLGRLHGLHGRASISGSTPVAASRFSPEDGHLLVSTARPFPSESAGVPTNCRRDRKGELGDMTRRRPTRRSLGFVFGGPPRRGMPPYVLR